jgi:hypothetical protein
MYFKRPSGNYNQQRNITDIATQTEQRPNNPLRKAGKMNTSRRLKKSTGYKPFE